ncbi:ferredoxin [Saccharothrix longispora]|uniref:ferredoxin n=1 Tax=Saccharothrix longispora TaxID=33920 RepID=UPI0028FD3376|nr:ferredoxin [Saccharothrix longispora]MDU0293405.1 ferredoxin [Saccharothrix longispora]
MGNWTVGVDRDTCIGTGMCTSTAPARFRLVDGLASPVDESVEPDDAVLDAADSCPMEAILVRDSAGSVLAPRD